jgi:hypothetical protein
MFSLPNLSSLSKRSVDPEHRGPMKSLLPLFNRDEISVSLYPSFSASKLPGFPEADHYKIKINRSSRLFNGASSLCATHNTQHTAGNEPQLQRSCQNFS